MGEIADMMLSGDLCECCGASLEAVGGGIPGYCSPECARSRGATWWLKANGYPVDVALKKRKKHKERKTLRIAGEKRDE